MNNIYKGISTATIILLLSACSHKEHTDIKVWMDSQAASLKGRIETIPLAKVYEPIPFEATNDPFVQKPILLLADLNKSQYAPDLNRRKEPLESYPLETIKMVGSLMKDNKFFAMIKTKDNIVHYVTTGNYLGTNFGKVTSMNESEVMLDEVIKDSAGEWQLKKSTVVLTEESPSKKQ